MNLVEAITIVTAHARSEKFRRTLGPKQTQELLSEADSVITGAASNMARAWEQQRNAPPASPASPAAVPPNLRADAVEQLSKPKSMADITERLRKMNGQKHD